MGATEIRRRQRRRNTSSPPREAQQPRPRDARIGAPAIPVIIRSTTAEILAGPPIMVQRIRYVRDGDGSPPVEGNIEAFGPLLEAMPLWGGKAGHLAELAWGPNDPVDGTAARFWAHADAGLLVLEPMLMIFGEVVDPEEPSSNC